MAKETEAAFETLERFVTTVRAGRALLNYPPGKLLSLYGAAKDGETFETLHRLRPHIEHLARGTVNVSPPDVWPSTDVLQLVEQGITVGLVVDRDVDMQKILERITRQQKEGVTETNRLTAKLNSAEFTAKAPPEIVAEHRRRLQSLQEQQNMLTSSEAQLLQMMRSRP